MGARKIERARGRHPCLPLARPFFLGPATQAKCRPLHTFKVVLMYYLWTLSNIAFLKAKSPRIGNYREYPQPRERFFHYRRPSWFQMYREGGPRGLKRWGKGSAPIFNSYPQARYLKTKIAAPNCKCLISTIVGGKRTAWTIYLYYNRYILCLLFVFSSLIEKRECW